VHHLFAAAVLCGHDVPAACPESEHAQRAGQIRSVPETGNHQKIPGHPRDRYRRDFRHQSHDRGHDGQHPDRLFSELLLVRAVHRLFHEGPGQGYPAFVYFSRHHGPDCERDRPGAAVW